MVGMPFADITDIGLKQRMAFFDKQKAMHMSECDGQQFYNNMCMRAVNQSIGRAFRHIKDYSVVVLFDERYHEHSNLLPSWIQRSYHRVTGIEEAVSMISKFFKSVN